MTEDVLDALIYALDDIAEAAEQAGYALPEEEDMEDNNAELSQKFFDLWERLMTSVNEVNEIIRLTGEQQAGV